MAQNNPLTILGSNVKEYRSLAGYSQEHLAELTGLHRTYIGGIERGERNVSLLNLLKISRSLNIKLSDLIKEIK